MDDTEPARSWRIDLPFTKPLSTNQVYGLHWRAIRSLTHPWMIIVKRKALDQKIPKLDRFTVILHYAPRTKRDGQRDLDNMSATLKPIVDGLKHARVCVDDNSAHYIPQAPVIHEATKQPGRIWLEIIELAPHQRPAPPI